MKTVFQDEDFQDALVCLLVKDRVTLKKCGDILTPTDFRPLKGVKNGVPRWVTAEKALSYWSTYRQPIKRMLKPELKQHIESFGMGDRKSGELLSYAESLLKRKPVASESVISKVLQYKKERQKAEGIQKLIELQSQGRLTDEEWNNVMASVNGVGGGKRLVGSDYFEELEARIERRTKRRSQRYPLLFIDPLDNLVHAVAPGHVGLLLAPYKRGKTLGLIWISLAYTLQKLNVLHITLEDLKEDVEDRYDAAVTSLPVKKLKDMPKTLRTRFLRYKRLVRSRLRIYDGSEGAVGIGDIESLILQERDKGFLVDAVVIDYDDEITPPRRLEQRRFEFAEIYRGLKNLATKYGVILWTAAQTQRGTAHLKILSGDKAAEDISKLRKVTFALSLGQGDWGEDSIYLWVAGHRTDRMHVGCNIMTNKERMIFYDRDKTLRKMEEMRSKRK